MLQTQSHRNNWSSLIEQQDNPCSKTRECLCTSARLKLGTETFHFNVIFSTVFRLYLHVQLFAELFLYGALQTREQAAANCIHTVKSASQSNQSCEHAGRCCHLEVKDASISTPEALTVGNHSVEDVVV